MQHNDTDTPLTKKLNASIRYLQLKLGPNICPLNLPYDTGVYLAPLTWIKMLLRIMQVSGFTVHLKYNTVPMSQRRDLLIMEFTICKGVSKEELLSIPRVRGLLCVICMSDIGPAD